jgi:hypothetical protein
LNQEQEQRNAGEEALTSRPSMLPRPIRTFSYLFFGTVALITVCGWIVSASP